MSRREQTYDALDEEGAKDNISTIKSSDASAKQFVEQTTDPDAIRYLVEDEEIDRHFHGHNNDTREKILRSETTPFDVKQTVPDRDENYNRDRDSLGTIRVPDRVERNARTALQVGKPVVLYGPTGTGKTHFAKQLLAEACLDYELATATPTWTPGDITGNIQPELDDGDVEYRREAGCVSRGIQQADRYGEWGVLLDEITRADISQVFGPLYTAVEDDSQTIFVDGEGRDLQLTDDVNIVCTMNMSDRTVNELDDAITRRFAMIELRGYEEADRRKLYDDWLDAESVFEGETTVGSIDPTPESGFTPGRERLIDLFEAHHKGINEGGTTDEDTPITEFGPMHYRDVIQFVGVACGEGGAYEDNRARAVGEAFATYVVPRLLNTAALPQIERLADHYRTLDEAFSVFDLGPVVELVERQAETERRGIAGGAYE